MPRRGGLTSLVAGTMTMDLFLANRVARREGEFWDGGEGKEEVSDEDGSAGLLCSSSFKVSFLEVMVTD